MSCRSHRFCHPSLDFHARVEVSIGTQGCRQHSLAPQGEMAGVRGDKIDRISDLYLRFGRSIRSCLAVLLGFFLMFPFSGADAGQIPAELIRRNARVQASELVVSAQSLIPRVKNGEKITLIDVRNASEYKALHIPGALNIPLHFIKTKPFLKSSLVVLVDQGLSFHRLSLACRELRKKGFDVRILDGGMNAWSSRKGSMVGEPVRQMDYCRISPADFFLEKDDANHIVCDVSTKRSPASVQLMPYAVHLPLAGSPDRRVAELEKFRSAHARNGEATLILVDEKGDEYPNVRSIFNRAGYKNVFYLTGGANAYKKYIEGLARSWLPRNERMVTYAPCSGCPDSEK